MGAQAAEGDAGKPSCVKRSLCEITDGYRQSSGPDSGDADDGRRHVPARPFLKEMNAEALLTASLDSQSLAPLRETYLEQGEFLLSDGPLLPEPLLERWKTEVQGLLPLVHRSTIPGHKQGGSVGFQAIASRAPSIRDVYRSPALVGFLSEIVGERIEVCPRRDQHSCALYVYSRTGDHIGFHYDTSYYRGARYTVLVGVHDDSSSRLVCRLHTRDRDRTVEVREVRLAPGQALVFNGDMVEHAVTPIRAGETRTVITMQYVTSGAMRWTHRVYSDLKDAFGYFGIRTVLLGWR